MTLRGSFLQGSQRVAECKLRLSQRRLTCAPSESSESSLKTHSLEGVFIRIFLSPHPPDQGSNLSSSVNIGKYPESVRLSVRSVPEQTLHRRMISFIASFNFKCSRKCTSLNLFFVINHKLLCFFIRFQN